MSSAIAAELGLGLISPEEGDIPSPQAANESVSYSNLVGYGYAFDVTN